jgi:hypothetical protein
MVHQVGGRWRVVGPLGDPGIAGGAAARSRGVRTRADNSDYGPRTPDHEFEEQSAAQLSSGKRVQLAQMRLTPGRAGHPWCSMNVPWRRELAEAFGSHAHIVDGLGAVSVVAGINAAYENVRRGSACLHNSGIQSFGLATSSFRATWLVQRTELDDAVRLLHGTFIEHRG